MLNRRSVFGYEGCIYLDSKNSLVLSGIASCRVTVQVAMSNSRQPLCSDIRYTTDSSKFPPTSEGRC